MELSLAEGTDLLQYGESRFECPRGEGFIRRCLELFPKEKTRGKPKTKEKFNPKINLHDEHPGQKILEGK